jgi:hypothetical protein
MGRGVMNRKQVCLNQARLCRERAAAADPKGRNYWSKQAGRWQKAADDCSGKSAIDPVHAPAIDRLLNRELPPAN